MTIRDDIRRITSSNTKGLQAIQNLVLDCASYVILSVQCPQVGRWLEAGSKTHPRHDLERNG